MIMKLHVQCQKKKCVMLLYSGAKKEQNMVEV